MYFLSQKKKDMIASIYCGSNDIVCLLSGEYLVKLKFLLYYY